MIDGHGSKFREGMIKSMEFPAGDRRKKAVRRAFWHLAEAFSDLMKLIGSLFACCLFWIGLNQVFGLWR